MILLCVLSFAYAVDAEPPDFAAMRAVVLLRVGESIPLDPPPVDPEGFRQAEVLEVYSGDLEPGDHVPVIGGSKLANGGLLLGSRHHDRVSNRLLPLHGVQSEGEALCHLVGRLRARDETDAPDTCAALDPPLGAFRSDGPTLEPIPFDFKGEEYYRAAAESTGQLMVFDAQLKVNRQRAEDRERAARWIAENRASETSPKPDPEPTPPE